MPYRKRKDQIERILNIASRIFSMQNITLAVEAERFGVSERTIRRDLAKIGQTIPLRHTPYGVQIDLHAGNTDLLDHALLQAFAESARIRAACLDRHTLDPQTVELAIRYHRLPKKLGERVLEAIHADRLCRFDYKDKEHHYSKRTAAPVKLLSAQGVWYLIAYDMEKKAQRNFRLDRIRKLEILDTSRNLPADTLAALEAVRDPWSDIHTTPEPIRLYADPYAANYLEELPLHPSQSLEEAHADGGAVFLYRITHPMELMPRIKSWIPHIRILEPAEWQNELKKELQAYLRDI
ncbi:helix-turn-helix transcriptional regulator [Hydrogenimonas sp.]